MSEVHTIKKREPVAKWELNVLSVNDTPVGIYKEYTGASSGIYSFRTKETFCIPHSRPISDYDYGIFAKGYAECWVVDEWLLHYAAKEASRE